MRTKDDPKHEISGKNAGDRLTVEHFRITENGPEFKIELIMPQAHDGQYVVVTATTEGID